MVTAKARTDSHGRQIAGPFSMDDLKKIDIYEDGISIWSIEITNYKTMVVASMLSSKYDNIGRYLFEELKYPLDMTCHAGNKVGIKSVKIGRKEYRSDSKNRIYEKEG